MKTKSIIMKNLDSKTNELEIEGLAIVYNKKDSVGDVIVPGSITKETFGLNGRPVDLLMNHNMKEFPLASTRNNTLSFSLDEDGVRIKAKLPDTQAGRDMHTLIKDGYVDGMSFGFIPAKEKFNNETKTNYIEKIATIYEITITHIPAYTDTDLRAKSEEFKVEEPKLVNKKVL